jgi:hypothetical protein
MLGNKPDNRGESRFGADTAARFYVISSGADVSLPDVSTALSRAFGPRSTGLSAAEERAASASGWMHPSFYANWPALSAREWLNKKQIRLPGNQSPVGLYPTARPHTFDPLPPAHSSSRWLAPPASGLCRASGQDCLSDGVSSLSLGNLKGLTPTLRVLSAGSRLRDTAIR